MPAKSDLLFLQCTNFVFAGSVEYLAESFNALISFSKVLGPV